MNLYLWHWPQWTVAILWAIDLIGSAAYHGKQGAKISFPGKLIRIGFAFWILASAGFFSAS